MSPASNQVSANAANATKATKGQKPNPTLTVTSSTDPITVLEGYGGTKKVMVFNSPWSHSVGRSKQWRRKRARPKLNAAAIYEEQKVKAIFGPLAAATLDAVSISDADTILDVACGTGIMARCLRERLGPSVRISGADLNEGMIDTARALTSGDPDGFDWKIADATNMPFADESFSVVFCQQGIQFFPDDRAAVTEMRRVLMKDGRLYLSVWAGANDFFLAMAQALSNHVSPKIGQQSLAPFAYDGSGTSS